MAVLALVLLAGFVYCTRLTRNSAGFYIDESSIAYNAYTVSQTGRDEHGELLPLFFRAFGDHKNPTYIYLLALIFRIFGPGILIARFFSALLGIAAAAALGAVAVRISGRRVVGGLVVMQALLTPWLFENSRLVFEVALYPLALALFLLTLARAAPKPSWSWFDSTLIALTLALLTYSYTIGRLLAPLLAIGLAIFLDRVRWRGVLQTWAIYLLALIPLLIFKRRHPGVLSGRFTALTYLTPNTSASEAASQFVMHYLRNFSLWRMLATGEINLRDHVPGMGSLLLPTMILATAGLWLIARDRGNAWWRFMIYGLLVAAVPASLTVTEFPTLRLIAVPVFLLVLTIPALMRLTDSGARSAANESSTTWQRALLVTLIGCILVQGLIFQWQFNRGARQRSYLFDSHYPQVLAAALAEEKHPIYLRDRHGATGYIQAYWYGTLQGLNVSESFRHNDESVPPNSVVISTEGNCVDCRLLLRGINYIVYVTTPDASGIAVPLPETAFRARIVLAGTIPNLHAGQQERIPLMVENLSSSTWPAFGASDGRYAVVVRSVWRNAETKVLATDFDGAAKLSWDLTPGNKAEVQLPIKAPRTPGNYLLEIDLVQNQTPWFVKPSDPDTYIDEQQLAQIDVTWFHQHGSVPLQLKLRVE